MASPITPHSKSILAIKLSNFNDVRKYLSVVATAAHRTTERLLIILCSELLNASEEYSHTEYWEEVQALLASVYVETSHIAQEADRVLLDVDVLLRGLDEDIYVEDIGWERTFLIAGGKQHRSPLVYVLLLTPVFEKMIVIFRCRSGSRNYPQKPCA